MFVFNCLMFMSLCTGKSSLLKNLSLSPKTTRTFIPLPPFWTYRTKKKKESFDSGASHLRARYIVKGFCLSAFVLDFVFCLLWAGFFWLLPSLFTGSCANSLPFSLLRLENLPKLRIWFPTNLLRVSLALLCCEINRCQICYEINQLCEKTVWRLVNFLLKVLLVLILI